MQHPPVSEHARFDLVVVLLAMLTAFGPLSIDMYLPAFNDIALTYKTDSSGVELSLTAFSSAYLLVNCYTALCRIALVVSRRCTLVW